MRPRASGLSRRARLAGVLLSALLASSCGAAADPDFSHRPVLFVHGHGLDGSDWDRLIAFLERRGHPREFLYAVDIVPDTMANERAARRVLAPAVGKLLARAAERAREAGREPPARIDIVAHSMGALSARYYAAELEPARVATLITIGGANHGSDYMCRFDDPGADDMCPAYAATAADSAIQLRLNGAPDAPRDETPWGAGEDPPGRPRVAPDARRAIAYFTVRIEPDRWIEPAASALLAGAGGAARERAPLRGIRETAPGNFLVTGSLIHDDMPWNSRVMSLVAALLDAPDALETR